MTAATGPPASPRRGLCELNLRVSAVPCATIATEKARLESPGAAVAGPVRFDFWKADSIFFSDPDDHRVEFCGFDHLNDANHQERSL